MVISIARLFGTGSVPGCARQTGHVREFSGAKYSSSQRQNIFVRVFRWTWISRPMTGSQALVAIALIPLTPRDLQPPPQLPRHSSQFAVVGLSSCLALD